MPRPRAFAAGLGRVGAVCQTGSPPGMRTISRATAEPSQARASDAPDRVVGEEAGQQDALLFEGGEQTEDDRRVLMPGVRPMVASRAQRLSSSCLTGSYIAHPASVNAPAEEDPRALPRLVVRHLRRAAAAEEVRNLRERRCAGRRVARHVVDLDAEAPEGRTGAKPGSGQGPVVVCARPDDEERPVARRGRSRSTARRAMTPRADGASATSAAARAFGLEPHAPKKLIAERNNRLPPRSRKPRMSEYSRAVTYSWCPREHDQVVGTGKGGRRTHAG